MLILEVNASSFFLPSANSALSWLSSRSHAAFCSWTIWISRFRFCSSSVLLPLLNRVLSLVGLDEVVVSRLPYLDWILVYRVEGV